MIFLATSCSKEKDFIYFQQNQKNAVNADTLVTNYVPVLKKNDLLTISVAVNSQDPEASKPFNLGGGGASTYLIDEDGNIEFPILGTIKLVGLTKSEALALLTERIKNYIKNPIINLRISNFKVTVLGDVAHPGLISVPNEKITLIEAIGSAGDIVLTGNRKKVLVISENQGIRKETWIDMTGREIFSSPAYYLNQNDVVYVQMSKIKVKQTSDIVKYSGLVISISSFAIGIFNFLSK
jgi:polysaccharide export outer membrane protein